MGMAERFEEAITAKIAAESRLIELGAKISEQADRIEELKKEVEKSLQFVAKAEADRIQLFSNFLAMLTEKERAALKSSLISQYGLKE